MPVLQNLRHENFARYRAEGARLEEAYEWAGFVPDSGHAARLAGREEVAERITEIRVELDTFRKAKGPALVATLLAMAETSAALGTAQGLREARLTLLGAAELQASIAMDGSCDRIRIESQIREDSRRAQKLNENRYGA